MNSTLRVLLLACLAFVILLSGCSRTGSPNPVEPVSGMPAGTGGFPWWNDTVFYQVFVRSFYDSDGDGIGDFNGLIEKLDYLNDGDPQTTNDLGVTALWLMPVNPSPSYHGYDVTDYYQVNPDYGSMEDFKRLLDEAHRRNIRVVMDLVLNHTSAEHPWFKAARRGDPQYRDWYIWEETNPGFAGPWGQQVWHPTGKDYYYGIFWSGMPDLNYENPEVTRQMQDVARFWLEEVGVDGFRLDGAQHLVEDGQVQKHSPATLQWFREFRPFVKTTASGSILIGEVWDTNFAVKDYVQGDIMDLVFNFDQADAMVKAAAGGSARGVVSSLSFTKNLFPPGQYGSFLTNHDMDRVMTQLNGSAGAARVAASIMLTVPGVPFIYYGEEIGMTGAKPDEFIRTPMQWTGAAHAGFTDGRPWMRANPGFEERNVEAQLADDGSLLIHYRSLVAARSRHSALRIGEYTEVKTGHDAVLAYLRITGKEAVLVVVNLGRSSISDYNLALDTGLLSEKIRPVILYQDGFPEGSSSIPELIPNEQGGFASYQPVSELPAHSTLILQWQLSR